jgi:hypothetical protein
MPREDLRPSQDFMDDLLQGLPAVAGNQRLASLVKTAIVSADPVPEGFMHIAGDQFLFEAADAQRLGSYPWDDGGVWKLVATQDGRKMLVRADKYDEIKNAGLLTEGSLVQEALQAEPPEHTIPPEVARDKYNRLQEKARTRDLSQQEQELMSALEDALRHKGLLD